MATSGVPNVFQTSCDVSSSEDLRFVNQSLFFEDLCFADWVFGGTLFWRTSVLLTGVSEVYSFLRTSVLLADENPRNVGSLPKADPDVGTGLVGAPACGDVMKLQIRVDGEGKITEAKFKTFGCGSAIVRCARTD